MDDSYPEWYEKRYYREIIKREHFIHLYSCLCSIVAIVNDDKFDVFNIEVTDKNRIRLEGEDLYNCGLWLKKQKFDCLICLKM